MLLCWPLKFLAQYPELVLNFEFFAELLGLGTACRSKGKNWRVWVKLVKKSLSLDGGELGKHCLLLFTLLPEQRLIHLQCNLGFSAYVHFFADPRLCGTCFKDKQTQIYVDVWNLACRLVCILVVNCLQIILPYAHRWYTWPVKHSTTAPLIEWSPGANAWL